MATMKKMATGNMKFIWALLLSVTVVTAVVPGAAAGQFRKPVYYKTNDNVWGIVSADFNQDGIRDLAFAEFFSGQVGIMLGKGNGAFEPPSYFTVPGALQLAVGDFNGDHKLDLAVVEYGGTGHSALGIFLGDGQGNFKNSATYELGIESNSLAVADFNGDGHLDVAVTNRFGYGRNGKDGSVLVFFGKGDGTLRKPDLYELGGQPYGIAIGDLNGDHHPDLAITQDTGRSVAIFMNSGHGKFTPTVTYKVHEGADYVAIADLDHNGTLDLAVSDDGGVDVLLGNGDGTFGNATLHSTWPLGQVPVEIAIADFNGDGNPDLAVVLSNGYPGVFYGNGDGTFWPVMQIKSILYSGYALTAGDFNEDGKPDLAVGALSRGIGVLIDAE